MHKHALYMSALSRSSQDDRGVALTYVHISLLRHLGRTFRNRRQKRAPGIESGFHGIDRILNAHDEIDITRAMLQKSRVMLPHPREENRRCDTKINTTKIRSTSERFQ